MPALPNVPNVLRFKHIMENNATGPIAHVRQYFLYAGGPPSNADCTTLANDAQTAFGAHLLGLMSVDWQYDGCEVTDLTSPTAGFGASTGAIQVGTAGGNALPADTCSLVNHTVHRRYRGGHPREYWPLGVESHLADITSWSTTYQTAFATDYAAFVAAILAATAGTTTLSQAVNASLYEGFTVHTGTTGRARNVATPRSTALVDPILTSHLNPVLAVQRRRRAAI